MRRYPYHRYLTYLVLNGDAIDDIVDHVADLEFVPPARDDVVELRSALRRRRVTAEVRAHHDVTFFDDESPALDTAFWLVETPAPRTAVERLLLDRVPDKTIATIATLKFGRSISSGAVDTFRRGFWDTNALTPVDFSDYFRRAGSRKPDPPPEAVSLTTRPHYAAWKHGLHPDVSELSPDAMIREIQVDAFMMAKEAMSGATKNMSVAKAMAELVIKTTSATKNIAAGRKGKTDSIPDLQPLLVHPTADVATLGDLHSEYSDAMSGTGATSRAMGAREEGGDDEA